MLHTFVIYHSDAKGDLVDVEFYDHKMCMVSALEYFGILTMRDSGGQKEIGGERSLSYGPTDTTCDDVEYPVYCGWCGEPMNKEAIKRKEGLINS